MARDRIRDSFLAALRSVVDGRRVIAARTYYVFTEEDPAISAA